MSTSPATPTTVRPARLGDFLDLTKPRLSLLVLTTTLVGYLMASPPELDALRLLAALVGTTLVVAGANAMNQVYERDVDALMARTRNRPLPSGRLWAWQAGAFGLVVGAAGIVLLTLGVNSLSAALGAGGFVLYVFIYTPLKQITRACTLVGAIPGAIPPLIGWAAATGELDSSAAVLFGVLFLWQMPHFLAIARLYRADYARAGMVMLGLTEHGTDAYRTMVAFCVVLIPVSVSLTWLGATGTVYLVGALLLGFGFLGMAIRSMASGSRAADRGTFLYSLVYLTVLLVLMIADRTPTI